MSIPDLLQYKPKLTSSGLGAKGDVSPPPESVTRARIQLVSLVAFGVVLVVVFGKPLCALAVHAAGSNLHSHILLIPLISAYLVYLRREQLPASHERSAYSAGVGFVISLALVGLDLSLRRSQALSYNDHLALMALAFVCYLVAGGMFFFGLEWMWKAAFPTAFLLFMIPLPDGAADFLETASKLASAEAANLFFELTATPILREGTIFQLPGIVLEVAQECSGIRSSWVLFITSILASQLFLKSPWRRMALVAFVIPLGIIRNGFRILVIGLLCVHIGPQMIHSAIHRHGGPLFFSLSLVPLFLFLWWLRRGEPQPSRGDLAPAQPS